MAPVGVADNELYGGREADLQGLDRGDRDRDGGVAEVCGQRRAEHALERVLVEVRGHNAGLHHRRVEAEALFAAINKQINDE